MTPEILKQLVKFYSPLGNLLDLRFLIICLVSFTGFLRISELLNVQVKHLNFPGEGVKIFLPKSKTDQLREGNVVHIGRLESTLYCPVFWLSHYIEKLCLQNQPESYIICRLFKTKKGHVAPGRYQISYLTVRTTFIKHLSKVIEPKNYCLHSLRSGGASSAADNESQTGKFQNMGDGHQTLAGMAI